MGRREDVGRSGKFVGQTFPLPSSTLFIHKPESPSTSELFTGHKRGFRDPRHRKKALDSGPFVSQIELSCRPSVKVRPLFPAVYHPLALKVGNKRRGDGPIISAYPSWVRQPRRGRGN